jgi:hypothetical protein
VISSPFSNLSKSVRVFCFLDLEHPAVAWAVMRGMMVSADYSSTPDAPGFISFMQAGMVDARDNRRIFNEDLIERIRQVLHRHQISRMRGMFFFRSEREALDRVRDPNWPSYFLEENLLELELLHEEPFTDVDANWITHADLLDDYRLNLKDLGWIEKYWAGVQYNDHPVWERLAKGVALVLDEKARPGAMNLLARCFHNRKSRS